MTKQFSIVQANLLLICRTHQQEQMYTIEEDTATRNQPYNKELPTQEASATMACSLDIYHLGG